MSQQRPDEERQLTASDVVVVVVESTTTAAKAEAATTAPPPLWEQSKENAAPARGGRNIQVLESALSSSQHDKDRRLRHYQSQVESISPDHPDPLRVWLELIHYVHNFHQPQQPIPMELLEDCVLQFCDDPRYANDKRFVTVCCRYANSDPEPLEAYRSLFTQGIGNLEAKFYMGWAWHAETLQDVPLALEIIDVGIRLQAEPVAQLSQRYQQIVRRKNRRDRERERELEHHDDSDGGHPPPPTTSRRTLGSLTASAVRRNDRTATATSLTRMATSLSTFTDRTSQVAAVAARRSGTGNTSSNRNDAQRQASSGWQIHVDDDHENDDQHEEEGGGLLGRLLASRRRRQQEQQQQQQQQDDREGAGGPSGAGLDVARVAATATSAPAPAPALQRQAERRKENVPRVEAWNERGTGLEAADGGSSGAAPSKPPAFEVFVDPECAARIDEDEKKRQQELQQQQRWIRGGASASAPGTTGAGGGATTKDATANRGKSILWWDVANSAMDTQLLRGPEGEELSLEEARARAGHYRILVVVPPDLNTEHELDANDDDDDVSTLLELKSSSSFESSADMNQSADATEAEPLGPIDGSGPLDPFPAGGEDDDEGPRFRLDVNADNSLAVPAPGPTSLPRNRARTLAVDTSVDTDDNESINTTTGVLSVASSSVLAGPSPTVNTKWALDQLSVMFYSPGPHQHQAGHPHPAGDASLLDPVLPHAANASFASQELSHAGFDDNDNDDDTRDDGCKPAVQKGLGAGGGFTIFCDDEFAAPLEDDDRSEGAVRPEATALPAAPVAPTRPTVPTTGAFEIYQDDSADDEKPPATPGRGQSTTGGAEAATLGGVPPFTRSAGAAPVPTTAHPPRVPRRGFEIYREDAEDEDLRRAATRGPDLRIQQPGAEQQPRTAKASSSGFTIYCDGEDDGSKADADHGAPDLPREIKDSLARLTYDDGDTASFSEMGDLLADLPGRGHGTWGESDGETADIGLLQELLRQQSDELSTDDVTGELPAFGDVSCIDPVGFNDPTTTTARLELESAVHYKRAHEQDVRGSCRRIMDRAFGAAPDPKRSLVDQLSSRGFLRNYPTATLPRMFKLSSRVGSTNGQELRLGSCAAPVLCELGRGSYGVVALLGGGGLGGKGRRRTEGGPGLAVKVQREAGMLAWEYEVLDRLRDRVRGSSTGRFPTAHSMVFFADGAMLGMTPALATGATSVNLIDLVNLYHSKAGLSGVPEVLALHYTAQMLHTIETLHWKGKVLHCDVKADNWLVANLDETGMAAPDLMLIDFGRAVDLEGFAPPESSPYDVRFVGDAARGDEMKCVAMRHGLTWSFDVDTHGICASAHVLLFAEHMELVRVKPSGRYMPRRLSGTKHRHNHLQFKDVWRHIFESLLNVDGTTKKAIDSRPASLRMLRSQVTGLLDRHRDELAAALRHQASIVVGEGRIEHSP